MFIVPLKNFAYSVLNRAMAVDVGVQIPGGTQTDGKGYDYIHYMKDVYGFALRLGGLLAMMMVIYGGYKIMTAKGDDQTAKDGKDIIFGAVSGIIILYLIKALLITLGANDVGINLNQQNQQIKLP